MQDDLIERLRRRNASHTLPDYLGALAADRIAALEAELERRKYDGDHTCHEHCPRTACVLRREKAALEDDNARLVGLVKEAVEALEDLAGACVDHYVDTTVARAALAKIKEATDA